MHKFNLVLFITGIIIVIYTIVVGLTIDVPLLPVIGQSIRFLFYHVPMWIVMFAMWLLSFIYSIRFLKNPNNHEYELRAFSLSKVGVLFAVLGIVSGMIWAKYTWGKMWINDPKLNGAAISLLAYFAYLLLRKSSGSKELIQRIASIYNIMCFMLMLVLTMIMPRITQYSIHPGNKGGQSFIAGEMDFNLQIVFYPALVGWLLIAWYIYQIQFKYDKLKNLK